MKLKISSSLDFKLTKNKMADPIVEVEQGLLKGFIERDIKDDLFFSFLGVPFAKPPIGDLRFKDPQPPEKWEGIRDATKEGNPCIAVESFRQIADNASEDCLYLNVYTKNLRDKPVMVYIHGGAFTVGSSSRLNYGPEFLLTEDIVLVVIQYRLGALGFLSFNVPSLGVPGNAGLKDQVQALKWIKSNIKAFGGNPENVTIFGESAGAASVHYLILSPLAKGLFHKAILQSGTAINPWAQGVNDPRQLAKTLGCNETEDKLILEFLQKVPGKKIVEAQQELRDDIKVSHLRKFAPSIERKSENALITDEPAILLHKGEFNKVPIMIGYCSSEGMMKQFFDAFGLTTDSEAFVPYYLGHQESTNKKILQFYFKSDKVEENQEALEKVLTDVLILRGTYVTVRSHVKTHPSVYFYRMSLDAGLNFLKRIGNLQGNGAAHGDDLGYLFKNAMLQFSPESPEEVYVHRFVKLWTNFAKHGNPTPEGNDLDVTWKPVTRSELNFLDIGEELVPGVGPDIERMQFWDKITEPITEFF